MMMTTMVTMKTMMKDDGDDADDGEDMTVNKDFGEDGDGEQDGDGDDDVEDMTVKKVLMKMQMVNKKMVMMMMIRSFWY
jgi:hypothetical protein